jgi:hypothetical protein
MIAVVGRSIALMYASIWISARVQGYQRMIFVALMLLALCGVVASCILILVGVGVPSH